MSASAQASKTSNGTHVAWTHEEWASVARRAKTLKDSRPEMPWLSIVPVCQDDISFERRRLNFNKLSCLRPMFDILDLTEDGSPKPLPPPPPDPEPVVIQLPQVAPEPVKTLSTVSSQELVAELSSRMSDFRGAVSTMVNLKADIEHIVAENNQMVQRALVRIDEVEKLVMESLNSIDKIAATELRINAAHKLTLECSANIRQENAAVLQAIGLIDKEDRLKIGQMAHAVIYQAEEAVGSHVEKAVARFSEVNQAAISSQRKPMLRFLLFGPHQKEIARIKEKLPSHLSVELIAGENSPDTAMPQNIHYCLVSGHNDWTRRWQTARETYGDSKVMRMENGSIGTFVHKIVSVCSSHKHN